MPAATPHKLADGRYECQNCLRKFTKPERTYKEVCFCCDNCRKNFHANGGFSLKKVEARIEPKVRQWSRDELTAILQELRAEVLAAIPQSKRKHQNGAAAPAQAVPVPVNHGTPEPPRGRVSPTRTIQNPDDSLESYIKARRSKR